jgi:hypothetical protein
MKMYSTKFFVIIFHPKVEECEQIAMMCAAISSSQATLVSQPPVFGTAFKTWHDCLEHGGPP